MAYDYDDGYIGVGNAVLPLTASTANSLLKDADPVIFTLLDFVSGVIAHYVGSRWTAEWADADLAGTQPVAFNIGAMDPSLYMQQQQFKFPLLSIYRKSKRTINSTMTHITKQSFIDVVYTFPALDVRQGQKLLPFLNTIADVVDDQLVRGQRMFTDAGISEIETLNTEFTNIPTDETGTQYLPTILMSLRVNELHSSLATLNLDQLESVTTQVVNGDELPEQELNDILVDDLYED